MQKNKTLFNVLKKSILSYFVSSIKSGQKVTVLLLVRGTNNQMKIVAYSGLIVKIVNNQSKVLLTLASLAFNYNFRVTLNLTSINVVRFFYKF